MKFISDITTNDRRYIVLKIKCQMMIQIVDTNSLTSLTK